MLSADTIEQKLEQALLTTPCHLEVPDDWRPHVDMSVAELSPDDSRRFVRFPYRTRALLEFDGGLPALPRGKEPHVVCTRDISREGLGFMHATQIYPLERLRVWLPRGGIRKVEVMRCHKINPRCYTVGVRFV